MRKIIYWLKSGKKHKYLNGGKGVISILLVIVMLPFTSFADLMVESSRYHSAVTLLDESMDSSSLSVLADNDSYLFERFGLLATNNNADIEGVYTDYLEKNVESLNAWKISDISAEGKYPLTNNDVLIKQIAEFSQYGAPASLVNDIGLGKLISTLEKMTQLTEFFKLVDKAGDVTNKTITLAEDIEELRSIAHTFEENKNTYISKYKAFETAYLQVKSQLSNVKNKNDKVQDLEQKVSKISADSDTSKQLEEKKNELQELEDKKSNNEIEEEEYKTQKEELEKEIEELTKQLEEERIENKQLFDDLDKAKEDLQNANSELVSAKTQLNKAKGEYVTAINNVKTDISNYQTQADKVVKSIDECRSSAQNLALTVAENEVKDKQKEEDLKEEKKKLEDKIKNESDEELKKEYEAAKNEIDDQIRDLAESGKTINATGEAIEGEINSYADDVQETLKEYNSETLGGYITRLGKVCENVNGLNVDGISINSTFQKDMYYVELSDGFLTEAGIQTLINSVNDKISGGGLWDTLNALSTVLRSLFTTNLQYDTRLTAYIAESTGYTLGEIDLILQDLSNLMNLLDVVNNKITGWIDILYRIRDILNTMSDLGEHLIAYLSGLMSRAVAVVQEILSNECGEKILINQYMVKSLANRLSIDAGGKDVNGKNILTGYSFSKVKFAESAYNDLPILGGITDVIRILKDVKDGGDDIMFSAAEAEYILIGSRSEIINQVAVFYEIYFARLILDIAPILTNSEVQTIANVAGAASLGLAAPVVYVLYVLIEPLIDTILLVNGEDISLVKKVVYLTPTGCPVLVKRLTQLGVSSADEKKIKESVEKITKTTAKEGMGNDDEKGISWKYENYLFLLMLLTVDNDTCVQRFKNIVQLEAKAYYGQDKFDLNKTYTCIEGNVSGTFDPVLPFGGLATTGLFEQGRTRMRGY